MEKAESGAAITFKDVTKRFPNGADGTLVTAVDSVSFSVAQGSLAVLGGANGSGKSVLMLMAAGLISPTTGSVHTKSRPGLVFQDAATQLLGATPREDVAVGPRNQGVPKAEVAHLVERALSAVSLLHKADYPAEFLSGGEKRRLAVASILAMQRDIIIFDEPYANLDYPGVLDVNRLVSELHAQKKTVLLLTHELEKCLGLADHFVVLVHGRLVFNGNPEDALSRDISSWGIRNPLSRYERLSDLVWR